MRFKELLILSFKMEIYKSTEFLYFFPILFTFLVNKKIYDIFRGLFIINVSTNKEPQNPVFYLSDLVKKLDANKRNGIVALFLVNILVILFLKIFLNSVGLLS